jgi:hypothetical protein
MQLAQKKSLFCLIWLIMIIGITLWNPKINKDYKFLKFKEITPINLDKTTVTLTNKFKIEGSYVLSQKRDLFFKILVKELKSKDLLINLLNDNAYFNANLFFLSKSNNNLTMEDIQFAKHSIKIAYKKIYNTNGEIKFY